MINLGDVFYTPSTMTLLEKNTQGKSRKCECHVQNVENGVVFYCIKFPYEAVKVPDTILDEAKDNNAILQFQKDRQVLILAEEGT